MLVPDQCLTPILVIFLLFIDEVKNYNKNYLHNWRISRSFIGLILLKQFYNSFEINFEIET